MAEGRVDRDPEDPSVETAAALEPSDRLQRMQKRVLSQLSRVLTIAHHPQDQVVNAVLIALDQPADLRRPAAPAGAYVPDPLLTGKANFGFVSKYKKGASMPTGNTEFQFHAADLNFHSDSYDWLLVFGGGTRAKFKGEGTINGESSEYGLYKFILNVQDSDPDTFWIKIWSEDHMGVETVVYDNGDDRAIDGGSIVIHTK